MTQATRRRPRRVAAAGLALALAAGCHSGLTPRGAPQPQVEASAFPIARASDPRERRLANLRQLTDGGENAEAYFSSDGTKLIFQSTRPPYQCDQIFAMDLHGHGLRRLSTGLGRTTCAFFYPDGWRFLYASTHAGNPDCPPPPDRSQGYVWALDPNYEIYLASLPDLTPIPLTRSAGYDAEATVSPRGDRIVFTSVRDGDLELYTMKLDGSDVRRITHTPGYDGGAFFSPDGGKIVWRASRPEGDELEDYRRLLAQGLIRPSKLEIFVADADGTNVRQVTSNGMANFAPFFHPSGEKVIFCSNLSDPGKRNFDLYLVDLDGDNLERVTHFADFDGFPMFSPDGATLVFGSNRFNSKPFETNIFLADWVE